MAGIVARSGLCAASDAGTLPLIGGATLRQARGLGRRARAGKVGRLEARDRRAARPAPGDRSAWSHGPIARVQARPVPPSGTANQRPAEPIPVARPAAPAPAAAPLRFQAGHRLPMPLPIRAAMATALVPPGAVARPPLPGVRTGLRPPRTRRNVCPHFYMTSSRGAIPIQAPPLLKGLLRQPSNVSRCQLRGGVHLDEGYVNDVCLTPRFNQCVFYEDELTRE